MIKCLSLLSTFIGTIISPWMPMQFMLFCVLFFRHCENEIFMLLKFFSHIFIFCNCTNCLHYFMILQMKVLIFIHPLSFWNYSCYTDGDILFFNKILLMHDFLLEANFTNISSLRIRRHRIRDTRKGKI